MSCGIISELREFSSGIFKAVMCFFLMGPILAITGIGFLASTSTDGRGSDIATFGSAVNAWQQGPGGADGGYGRFDNLTSVTVSSSFGSLPLSRVTSSDSYPDTDGVTLPTLFLRRVASSSSSIPFGSVTYSEPPPVNGYAVPITIGTASPALGSRTDSEQATVVAKRVYTVDCKSDESVGTCGGRCNGAFQGRTSGTSRGDCWQWWILSEVCYVVDPRTGRLDTSGRGCLPSDGAGYASVTWGGVDSSTGLGPRRYTLSTSAPTTVTFPNVRVTVRSSEDPYVVALRLTSGSLTFGLSTQQKASIGSALLIIGLVITVATCGGTYAVVRGCARKRQQAPLQGYPQGAVILQTGAGGGPPMGQTGPYYAQPQQQPGFAMGGAPGYPPPPQAQAYGAYPPQQQQGMGYPPQQQGGYPPQGMGFPPQQGGGYPPQGYPPQGGYPMQQGGYPPQQQGYPPQGFPPQGYPPQGYPPKQQGGYPSNY
jgi:hypothetical protein